VAKIDRLAQVEKQQIMSALPDYLRTKFNSALSTLTDDNKTAEDILLAFTSVNQELDDHGLPYYIIVFCPRWYIEAGIISCLYGSKETIKLRMKLQRFTKKH
jgi:hypothetical protein